VLDELAVTASALAVHTDPDAAFLEYSSELGAGELALIGIEDFRHPSRAIASSSVSTQKTVLSVLENCHARIRQLYQSMIAIRQPPAASVCR